MIFSHRYQRALQDQKFVVYLPERALNMVFACLDGFDSPLRIQRDPYDNWEANSSIFEESFNDLLREHGWDDEPGNNIPYNGNYRDSSKYIIKNFSHEIVFDYIELFTKYLSEENYDRCRIKMNQIFDLHQCPWRISDGEFFKLDADFVGERLTATAHDALTANRFVGAAEEYAKARQELASGDVKDCIAHAAKSFESVLKVMTGPSNLSADRLIKKLIDQNYINDLPEDVRVGFGDLILKTLPFLRNRLASHGQGADIVEIPAVYGELALQLAAALHNFLIAKHLERAPPSPPKHEPENKDIGHLEDDLPF